MKSGKSLLHGINLKRYREVGPFKSAMRLEGIFEIELIHASTGIVVKQWKFKNLITNNGLDLLATYQVRTAAGNNRINTCFVGTGTTPPDPTDPSLENEVGSTLTTTTGDGATGNLASGFFGYRNVWLFGTSIGNGALTEIGLGVSSNNILCRQLILDELGSPTVINKTSDFQLRVLYTLNIHYASEETYSALVNGSPMDITRVVGSTFGWTHNSGNASPGAFYYSGTGGTLGTAYSGTGAAGSTPSGSLGTSSNRSQPAYSAGTYKYEVETQWLSATGNGNIKSLALRANTTPGYDYNHVLDEAITKNDTQRLVVQTEISWGRL